MKAKLTVNQKFTVGVPDKRIYGSFIEHLGRAVYGGIYEPGHETADEEGFRGDVLEMIREIDVPVVRYPGGNFVSGYNWEDGIGDREKRPKRLDLAWKTIEPNQIGLDEFQSWAKKAGTDVMMAVNLGTGTPAEAKNIIEYCNLSTDTDYANKRRENGHNEPYGIKLWCLGNEMDGPWQTGQKTADEYGKIAKEAAKIMKLADPDIELVACGSSNYNMPTFGDWELTVLDHTYDFVDYISMHQYYGNYNDNSADFLGRSVHMNEFIRSVAAICDTVKAKKHSGKTVNISFDEWNVWYHSNDVKVDDWQIAPPILEDVYNFEDALLVGCMLITLQNNCDRVKIACLAQLVNVIAPIMTQTGGKVWAQTIFYPYMLASKNGRGTVLKSIVESDTYEATYKLTIPYLEASVVDDSSKRELTVFAVNRSLFEDMELTLDLDGYENTEIISHTELYCDDLKAVNTACNTAVSPVEKPVEDPFAKEISLRKHSWNMIKIKY